MSRLSGSRLRQGRRRFFHRRIFFSVKTFPLLLASSLALGVSFVHAQQATTTTPVPDSEPPRPQESSTSSISREVKEVYDKFGKAVVKIRGTDEHGDLSGTGFFIDPAGTLYTAFSVGGDTENLTVEFAGKTYPARVMMTDLR